MDGLRGRSDWAPDGVTLAPYAGSPWSRDIFLLNVVCSNIHKITHGGNNLTPHFSPDGEWITFTSYRDNYGNEDGCEIYIMRPNGSEITRQTKMTIAIGSRIGGHEVSIRQNTKPCHRLFGTLQSPALGKTSRNGA